MGIRTLDHIHEEEKNTVKCESVIKIDLAIEVGFLHFGVKYLYVHRSSSWIQCCMNVNFSKQLFKKNHTSLGALRN